MPNFSTCLWFDNQAEEAVNFYVSLFPGSSIGSISRYGEAGPGEPGSVLTITFRMHGQDFMALNGGPVYTFTPAISFIVSCETQAEVDRYWQALTAGGQEVQCGWLVDRFGLSWQIVPTALGELMSDPDPEKVRRVTEAMLKIVKLDIAGLRKAYAGG
jgi:predicted 3-demethylubiquinone-9 3-methyltransferase (glyoxalase superfamily)